ncbi:54S ribosomal protein L39, mitochondrial [Phlyctochytrium planicorne]|nr:54S ribosomal protein L39, mitochondrial [Phlyctochytrium planicorne]
MWTTESKVKGDFITCIVNGLPWDLRRPLDTSGTLSFVPSSLASEYSIGGNGDVARDVSWHSAAHVLGWSLEAEFGDRIFLEDGPSLTNSSSGGFFYDALLSNSGPEWILKNLEKFEQNAESQGVEVFGLSLLNPSILRDLEILADPSKTFHLKDSDLDSLTAHAKKFTSLKAPFERIQVSRGFAAAMFCYNPIKLSLLSRLSPTATISLYRCGDFIDLCRGPHVAHTGQLQAFKVLRSSAAHLGSNSNIHASRVYGVAFSKNSQLKDWETVLEEASKRDHRVIGKQQGIFMMSPLAPGSAFMLPHGTRVANRLLEFIRAEYRSSGYDEVVTPIMFNKQVWETSGHWDNYREDMFLVKQDSNCSSHDHNHHNGGKGEEDAGIFGLKPMNCPGHCVLFDSKSYSYRDLPIRIAEFSPLHRNEASGALTGLTRVRKFHQDDAHIFCMENQVLEEIRNTLKFIDRVYTALGFTSYSLALSTRPDKYIGSLDQWTKAEKELKKALDETGRPISIKHGDGAFYGPKIDIMVFDAVRRSHQTATIQLDFNLPSRFNLSYVGEDGIKHTPVMIHRAALGSLERMMAILMEHHGGKWPFWISPRQAVVIPATSGDHVVKFAEETARVLSQNGVPGEARNENRDSFFYVDARTHDPDSTLAKRVRDAWTARYNFVIVVGEKELESGKLSVRTMVGDGTKDRSMSMTADDLLNLWRSLMTDRK